MNNEYYGVASTPMDDFIAHYGIKGMKWGVKKAISSGNDRALGRQYKKAQKKLAKLEKLASNGSKYAKKAAAYGTGAAIAGGVAGLGTGKIGRAMENAGEAVGRSSGNKTVRAVGEAVSKAGNALNRAGTKRVGAQITKGKKDYLMGRANYYNRLASDTSANMADRIRNKSAADFITKQVGNKSTGVSVNTLARIGAGAVGVGLGAAAARNAYRAATTKKHAAQAKQFRAEMNKAFAGTKYANGVTSTKKRRKNNG